MGVSVGVGEAARVGVSVGEGDGDMGAPGRFREKKGVFFCCYSCSKQRNRLRSYIVLLADCVDNERGARRLVSSFGNFRSDTVVNELPNV